MMFRYIIIGMDKRVRKTIAAIYNAFGECLKEGSYNSIAVEDILQKAKVSRSTFYAHFKTKDDVLDSLLRNIFHHVFSHSLQEEKSHDFSKASVLDYKHLFTHILYHLRDEGELVRAILSSGCRERFLTEMRNELEPLMTRVLREGALAAKDVPETLRIASALDSFISVVDYWFFASGDESPEAITDYFFALND